MGTGEGEYSHSRFIPIWFKGGCFEKKEECFSSWAWGGAFLLCLEIKMGRNPKNVPPLFATNYMDRGEGESLAVAALFKSDLFQVIGPVFLVDPRGEWEQQIWYWQIPGVSVVWFFHKITNDQTETGEKLN